MDVQALVDERAELWLTLAPLWLEREPRESDYARMVEVIQRHDLTLKELEWVFRLELAPVLARHQNVGGRRVARLRQREVAAPIGGAQQAA